jgi:DNA helicase-2/ATP-dependent DNA helicase PcrA
LPQQAGDPFLYVEGEATRQARFDYAAERLRLLYVGITRARRELSITWNRGRRGDRRIARALEALIRYRKEQSDG